MIPAGLAALAYVIAFVQWPGKTVTDTRIDMMVDPGLFLRRAVEVWSGTTDLGHVQSGQFVGYLFPMGPWYWLADTIGLSPWVAERIWLGTILAVAAWGTVRLVDVLWSRQRGVVHLVAGLLFTFNPYVVVFASRATVTLLATAVLPWVMLVVARGIRDPRSWRMPAAFGLLLAASGGGVNIAVLAWIMIAPAALLAWDASVGGYGWPAARAFAVRAATCALAGCLWWLLPVLLQGAYGGDFLRFTEQPETIWATTSLSESLRLLGYWPMYLGVGYGQVQPVMEIGSTYLFDVVVVLASLAVPAVALGTLRISRRWGYAPLFGLLAVFTAVVMAAGFPHGTAFSRTTRWAYDAIPTLQFLRTTYKAAPMLALALALLGGLAAHALVTAVASRAPSRVAYGGLALLACAPMLWALPLFTGRAIDERLAFGEIPQAWRAAVGDASKANGSAKRTMVLPGELFGDYRWGRTWDVMPPALSRTPVIQRQATRYADPRAAELLDSIDDRVQQDRLVPGQLPSLLSLLSVGQVLVPTDDDTEQSGGLDPARVAAALQGQPGLEKPAGTYGLMQTFTPGVGRGGDPVRLPQIRRYGTSAVPIARVEPRAGQTILEGGPDGVTELAAHGGLTEGRALRYAGDLDNRELAETVRSGAKLVFSDSNRRRLLTPSATRQNTGTTLSAQQELPVGSPYWRLWPQLGTAAQTVSVADGLADVESPSATGAPLYPQFRPAAALDGDQDTAWLADPFLEPEKRWMEIRLPAPRVLGSITIYPQPVEGDAPLAVGVSVNGGKEDELSLRPGGNILNLGATPVRTLRFRLTRARAVELFLGAGGIREVEIPGVTAREALRLPTLLAARTSSLDLGANEIDVMLQRTTADFPRRAGTDRGTPLARSELGALDAETGIRRRVTLPVARTFDISGWGSISPGGNDAALDAAVGLDPAWKMESSGRFEGVPGRRASSAFDGDPDTAWVGDVAPKGTVSFGNDRTALPLAASVELFNGDYGEDAPRWRGALQAPLPVISVRGPRAETVERVRIVPGAPEYARPTIVRVEGDGGAVTRQLDVPENGLVRLPEPMRTKSLKITVLRVRPPSGPAAARLLRAVAISEIRSPLKPPAPRREGPVSLPCGVASVEGPAGPVAMAVTTTAEDLDQGSAMRLRGCGKVALPKGTSTIDAPAAQLLRSDHLLLRSAAPRPALPSAPTGTATVVSGSGPTGIPDRVDLAVTGPSWLVLGESYSRGWRASCNLRGGGSRDLGASEPIDAFANGWQIDASCLSATFRFGPQRVATISYIISLVAAPVLVALLLWRRRRPATPAEPEPSPVPEDEILRLDWPRSLAAGGVITVIIGYLFGLPLGPISVLLLRRGINVRQLFTLGGLALGAVPIFYLARSAPDFGGYSFGYPLHNLLGHWAAVVGLCCIAGGCGLDTWRRLRARRLRAEPSPPDQDPAPATSAASPAGGEPTPALR